MTSNPMPREVLQLHYALAKQDLLQMYADWYRLHRGSSRVCLASAVITTLGCVYVGSVGLRQGGAVLWGCFALCAGIAIWLWVMALSVRRLAALTLMRARLGALPRAIQLVVTPEQVVFHQPDAVADYTTAAFTRVYVGQHTVFLLFSQDRLCFWLPKWVLADPANAAVFDRMAALLPLYRDAAQAEYLTRPLPPPAQPVLPGGEMPAFVLRWQNTEPELDAMAGGVQKSAFSKGTLLRARIFTVVFALLGVVNLFLAGDAGDVLYSVLLLAFAAILGCIWLSTTAGFSRKSSESQLTGWQRRRMLSPCCLVAGQACFLTASGCHVNRIPYRSVTGVRLGEGLLYLAYSGQVLAVPLRIFPGRAEAKAFADFVQKKAEMRSLILWLLTGLGFALSLYYAAFSNFNLGNLLVWILTGMLLVYSLLWRRMDPWLVGTVPGRVLLGLAAAAVLAVGSMIGIILAGQTRNTATGQEKVVVVLGCAVHGETPSLVLQYRLQTALDYYTAHPDVTLIVCGGKGAEENISEALAMQRWLVARGVPAGQILLEDKSTSTEENFRFANRILTEKGFDVTAPVAYVTNGFHCKRSGIYAAREGFADARALPAGLPLTQYPTCYLRESFALGYFYVCKQ